MPINALPFNKRIGLIAGNGSLPLLFADGARAGGYSVFAIAHEKETDTALSERVDDLLWIPVGQIQPIIPYFKSHDVTQTVLAGGLPKTHLFDARLDSGIQSILAPLNGKKDDLLLRAFAMEMEREKISVTTLTGFLPSLLAEEGLMTRKITATEEADIRWGWEMAKQIGALDIGQCVVVRNGVLLAVEAIEGTDAAILRGGALGRESAVVVKCLKPHQDVRFDLPTVGPKTIQTMIDVKATVLAVEAKQTLILEKETTLHMARQADIAIVGWTDEKKP
jgi:DUF1009 family protein